MPCIKLTGFKLRLKIGALYPWKLFYQLIAELEECLVRPPIDINFDNGIECVPRRIEKVVAINRVIMLKIITQVVIFLIVPVIGGLQQSVRHTV